MMDHIVLGSNEIELFFFFFFKETILYVFKSRVVNKCQL